MASRSFMLMCQSARWLATQPWPSTRYGGHFQTRVMAGIWITFQTRNGVVNPNKTQRKPLIDKAILPVSGTTLGFRILRIEKPGSPVTTVGRVDRRRLPAGGGKWIPWYPTRLVIGGGWLCVHSKLCTSIFSRIPLRSIPWSAAALVCSSIAALASSHKRLISLASRGSQFFVVGAP